MARPKNGNFNEVTGAGLVTKAATEDYRKGWDLIFGKNKENDLKNEAIEKQLTEQESAV